MSKQIETTLATALDMLYAIRREINSKKNTAAGSVAAVQGILKENSKELTAMMKVRRERVNAERAAKKAEKQATPKATRAQQAAEKVAKAPRAKKETAPKEASPALTVGQLKNKEIKVGRSVETILKVTRGKNGRNAVTQNAIIPVDQISVGRKGDLVWKKPRKVATTA